MTETSGVRRAVRRAVPVACAVGLLGCASASDPVAGSDTDVQLEVRRDVLVTHEPLGDVVSGELRAGDDVTARCFVHTARTNTGVRGTAVRIDAGRLSGYVATTDLPEDPSDRVMTFDVGEDDLRDRLPACPTGP